MTLQEQLKKAAVDWLEAEAKWHKADADWLEADAEITRVRTLIKKGEQA